MASSTVDLSSRDSTIPATTHKPSLFPPRPSHARVPATHEQRHIWLDLMRGNDALAYNEPMIVRFERPANAEVIAQSVDLLVRRHEALRTSFRDVDGALEQIIHADLDIVLPTVDLAHLTEDAREAAVRTLALQDAARPFDLAQAPLLRARIIRLADGDHRLALTLHHILFDGRALAEALIPELSSIHTALTAGRTPVLPPPIAQYGDYAACQQTAAHEMAWDRDLDFWRRTLADGARRVSLPVDRPRAATADRIAATESIAIDAPLVRAIEALARTRATSIYTVLLAAFLAQLRRYGSEDDITLGSVIDTRRSAALAGMVGYCLNTVALRGRPRPDQPFDDFLCKTRDMLFDVYEHAAVPFERVAQMLDGIVPGTEDGRFHVLFAMQPAPPGHETAISVSYLTPPRAKADLHLELEQNAAGLQARFTYDCTLFDAETICAIARHWALLLASIVAAPSTPLGDLAMQPAEELAAIAELNHGPRRAIPEATLHGLVEQTIAHRPDAIAVMGDGARWTYAELGARADAIAEYLRSAGVTEGALVALCVERSPAMIAAILGILKTGAAYVPLDASFPPARLGAIIADATPAAILSDASSVPLFDRWSGLLKVVGQIATVPSGTIAGPAGTPRSLAYVIYTSGSTGIPKGVEIEHRGVVNVIEAMRHKPGFAPGETMLAIARLSFDMSVPDVFLPLIAGGTIAIAPSETIVDPQLLAAAIERSGCTLVQATPATWQSLVTNGWRGRPGLKILCGGEALGRSLANDLLDRGVRLWNGYGPTETTIYTTMDEVDRLDAITIGAPIDNVEVRILDDRGHDVPCNVVGHLHIAGAGLARRYRDPALTERAFVDRDGRRFFHSGDVACRRRDGRIEWLGRSDGQIKIRGFRINVGDVEAAICTCPGVALAAVTAVDGTAGAKNDLAAYVMPRTGDAAPDFAALRAHLADKLPAYMIPTRYRVVEQMPLSSSGKIQRNALPPIGDAAVDRQAPDAPPRGDVEIRIAAIWRDVLELRTVGATDNFFDLGGHSLLAAKLIGRLSAEFDRRLPLATLLRAPTIRQLAAVLAADGTSVDTPRTIVIGERKGRPLFWIDATPNFRANYFRDLATTLDDDISLVGLPVDTERFAQTDDHACIETIATAMASAIVDAGHGGPHLVGGWCNGGVLALIVAHQLRARGEEVAAVVMLDAANQAFYRRKAKRIQREVAQFFRAPRDERIGYVHELVGGYVSRLGRRLGRSRDEATALLDLTDRYMRIIRDMDVPAYDGRVIRVEVAGGGGGCTEQWTALLRGPVTLVEVPGGHESVLRPPYVDALAKRICPLLTAQPKMCPPPPGGTDPISAA